MLNRNWGRKTTGVIAATSSGAITFALWLLTVTGCGAPKPPPPKLETLEVEFDGCREVLDGPICVVEERTLRVWVKTELQAEVSYVGAELDPAFTPREVQEGTLVRLLLAEEADRVGVRAVRDKQVAEWSLPLLPPRSRNCLGGLGDIPKEDWQNREQYLIDCQGRLDPFELGDAWAKRASELRNRDVSGDDSNGEVEPDRELEYARKAIAVYREHGRGSLAARQAAALVFRLTDQRRFGEALQVGSSLNELAQSGLGAQSAYFDAFHGAYVAIEMGDVRRARRLYQEALHQAERLGMDSRVVYSTEKLAEILQLVGLPDEAIKVYESLAPQDACDRGVAANSEGWALVLARESGFPVRDPRPRLESALSLVEECGSSFILNPVNVKVNLAIAEAQAARFDRAQQYLDDPELADLEPRYRVWTIDVQARVALSKGRYERALELYEELSVIGIRAQSREARWRAAVGQARILRSAGRIDEALVAFEEADSILFDESLKVPMHLGRDSMITSRDRASREWLELLIELQRFEEAERLARRSISQYLLSLGQSYRVADLDDAGRRRLAHLLEVRTALADLESKQDDLASDERRRALAEIRRLEDELSAGADFVRRLLGADMYWDGARQHEAGVLNLTFYPLPTGWAAIASDEETVEAVRAPELTASSEQVVFDSLLRPFLDRIRQARVLRIVPSGALKEIDFHALELDGRPLIERLPVVYGVDLTPDPLDRRVRGALVVGNPSRDLPLAEREAREVAELLSGLRDLVPVRTLLELEAGLEAVREGLAGVKLFHYAGHGQFSGVSGWQSGLALANGQRLRIEDILALERAPDLVVLSGCETGRSATRMTGESIGLGQAFLVAGSRRAVVAWEPVTDELARAFSLAFYNALSHGLGEREAAREAIRGIERLHSETNWSSFRIIER